jgi:hypothetical protein
MPEICRSMRLRMAFLIPFMSATTDSPPVPENEKTLEIASKSRVSNSEVDGARTRNLRIDSPVL